MLAISWGRETCQFMFLFSVTLTQALKKYDESKFPLTYQLPLTRTSFCMLHTTFHIQPPSHTFLSMCHRITLQCDIPSSCHGTPPHNTPTQGMCKEEKKSAMDALWIESGSFFWKLPWIGVPWCIIAVVSWHGHEVIFASPGIIVSKKIHAQLLCSSKRSTLPCVRKSRGMMKRPQGTDMWQRKVASASFFWPLVDIDGICSIKWPSSHLLPKCIWCVWTLRWSENNLVFEKRKSWERFPSAGREAGSRVMSLLLKHAHTSIAMAFFFFCSGGIGRSCFLQ